MNEIKGVSGIDQAVNAICTELEERKTDALAKAQELATIATTAENLPERKKDRAAVNKMKLDFDRERKDFEAKWKSAIGPVSDAYKGIVTQLDSSIKKIDKDLEDFEIARVEAKKKRIEEIYAEIEKPAEIADWLPLERIFQSKWLNVSASDKSIREAIQQEFDGMEMAYNSLTSIEHEWEKEGLEVLRETKSLELAMKKMTDLRKQAELIEQRKREEEERKRCEEEARRQAEEERQRRETEAKARAEEEARKKAEEEAQKAFEEPEFESEFEGHELEIFVDEDAFPDDPEPEFEENTEPEFLDDIPTEPAFDEPEEDENTVYLNYVIRIKARDNQKLMTILDQSGMFYEIDEVM